MMTKLVLELSDKSVDFHRGPQLQGVMFSHLNTEYADWLHEQQIHPYSQYGYETRDGISEWVINVLNDEAYNYIIVPLLDSGFKQFRFHGTDRNIDILSRTICSEDTDSIWNKCQKLSEKDVITIEFLSPTAFKQAGKYVIVPDLRLIYQSLVMRYAPMSDEPEQYNAELVNTLVDNSHIVDYRMHTANIHIGKPFITGFVGRLSIRVNGIGDLRTLARFLFRFGEYSGVGIKVGMGMGALRVVKSRSVSE